MAQPKGEGSIIRLEGTSKADCRLWRLRFNMDDGTRREKRFRGSHTAARRELERFRAQLESPEQEKPPCPTFAEYRPIGSSCAANRARCGRRPS